MDTKTEELDHAAEEFRAPGSVKKNLRRAVDLSRERVRLAPSGGLAPLRQHDALVYIDALLSHIEALEARVAALEGH